MHARLHDVLARTWRVLPRGTPLPDEDWHRRHGAISLLAVAHAPVLFVYALFADLGLPHAVLETLPVAAAAVAGRWSRASRRAREVLTTLALVVSSAVLVHVSGGFIELHFHFFVVVALVTLYQQWSPFLVAIAFVGLHHGIAGVVAPTSVYNHPSAVAEPWRWAAVHAGFIVMASAVGLANWKLNELARQRSEDYFRQLYEGERAVVQRLSEAEQIKSELVAAVSHEFRTPLTAILGLATTLETNEEATAGLVGDFAGRIRRQGRRLQQLVENVLEVERPLDVTGGSCDAATAVAASLTLAREGHRTDHAVTVDVRPGLDLPMGIDAAQMMLMNLVGNALKFARGPSPVVVRVQSTAGHDVVVEVINEGPAIPEDLQRRIFEPFVQGDSSATRRTDGVGLGLHIVQRVVASAGGRVEVVSQDDRTTFRVLLPAPSPTPGVAATTAGLGAAPRH